MKRVLRALLFTAAVAVLVAACSSEPEATFVSTSDIIDSIREYQTCLLYTSPSPRDRTRSRMPSSA